MVTIPYVASTPLNSLGQTFTVEATIRADYIGGGTQTLFTNRYLDASYSTKGLAFMLYNGRYLLCQFEGQNYYSLSDPGMSLAAGGCHHLAVSHDASNQLHFYIDGVPAAYAPTTTRSAASAVNVSFGNAPHFSLEGFVGQLGELRVWNTARSAADIQALPAAGLTTPQAGLVGIMTCGARATNTSTIGRRPITTGSTMPLATWAGQTSPSPATPPGCLAMP